MELGALHLGALLVEVARFARLSVSGFSLALPLVGAAAVSAALTPLQVAGLVAVGLAFHVFGYVSNDVIDLPIDRTQPLRAASPLVRGRVRPGVAMAIALAPVPIACAAHLWAGGPPAAAGALSAGMGLGLLYNLYGKRLPFPPLSDAVQALAWVALMAYGALAGGAAPRAPMLASGVALRTPVAWAGAIVFAYVMLVNGLHGGLRDLGNDERHGARTTARLLGARETREGLLAVPRALMLYGLGLQLLVLALSAASFRESSPVVAAILAGHLLLFGLGRAALRARSRPAMLRAGTWHLLVSIAVVCLPFATLSSPAAALALVAASVVPAGGLLLRLRFHRLRPAPAVSAAALWLALGAVAAAARGQEVRVVPRAEIVRAMAAQRSQGYELRATANGARFNAGVLLDVAGAARRRDPGRTPLVLDHRDYFAAFLAVTGLSRDEAPTYVKIAFDHREDQYVDYRSERVLAEVVEGPEPQLALNVVGGWRGPPPSYTYEDREATPPLRVTRERVTSYRLLDLGGERILLDEIQGVSGRALGGLLGLLFRFVGDAHAVRSFLGFSADGWQVTVTTGRKGVSITTSATVDPAGRGEKGVPRDASRLREIERALREPFRARYAPLRAEEPLGWTRVPTPPGGGR